MKTFLSQFAWFRRWCGGRWYFVSGFTERSKWTGFPSRYWIDRQAVNDEEVKQCEFYAGSIPVEFEFVVRERIRQLEEEGFDAAHDDGHTDGELAMMAALYATPNPLYEIHQTPNSIRFIDPFPFDPIYDKRPRVAGGLTKGNLQSNMTLDKEDRIKQLVQATALLVAEIERLRRGR